MIEDGKVLLGMAITIERLSDLSTSPCSKQNSYAHSILYAIVFTSIGFVAYVTTLTHFYASTLVK